METPEEAKRILVVDDDAGVCKVIGAFLKRTGSYEVRAVSDSSHALSVASIFRPHLVVLDIVMPGLDGGELLGAIRDIPGLHDVPAVFLTGLVSESEVATGGLHRADDPVIAKPVRAEPFRRLVEDLLTA